MVFSIIFTIPFLIFMFLNMELRILLQNLNFKILNFMYFRILLMRLTKLPAFGFHIWLPKVHVEAPILTSIVLARLLLKSRLVVLIYIFNNFNSFNLTLVLYLVLYFCILATLILIRQ